MKRGWIILLIAAITSLYFCSCRTRLNLDDLVRDGFEIDSNYYSDAAFISWNNARIVAGTMNGELIVFLIDKNGNVVYEFPRFVETNWFFYEIRAIRIVDINRDGLQDIIFIADYLTGVGREGPIPFPVCHIYFQFDKKFKNLIQLDDAINRLMVNESPEMVLQYLDGKDDYINTLLGEN